MITVTIVIVQFAIENSKKIINEYSALSGKLLD